MDVQRFESILYPFSLVRDALVVEEKASCIKMVSLDIMLP